MAKRFKNQQTNKQKHTALGAKCKTKSIRTRAIHNRRMMTPCPQSRRFLSRTVYASDQQGSCEWGPTTSPGYQYSAKSFNFSMALFNELGNVTQHLGVVDNYGIGKCLERKMYFFLFVHSSFIHFSLRNYFKSSREISLSSPFQIKLAFVLMKTI